jgi:two-component system, chemotaxis family, protein-glutamate methylesterase/glutaminase
VEAGPIRVLLVDDSPFVRRAVERMLTAEPGIEVVGIAADGREGVDKVRSLRPDVVILDIVMPDVDGLEAIERIMATAPTPILVLSSQAMPGADVTLRALELGAVDFVSKNTGTRMDIYELAPTLREKVHAVAGSRVGGPVAAPPEAADAPAPTARVRDSPYELLVIGASTGGPRALASLLARLPGDLPAGVLMAQHMPPGFTATLAQRLDRRSPLRVREASDGVRIEPGMALLGVGGRHLLVERDGDALVARVADDADGLIHRPSVDRLFASAANAAGSRAVGVILTGMGQDGANGLAAIRNAGGRTFAESEDSAVIYGMPRAASQWADRILPLDRLPDAIVGLFDAGAD